MNDKELLTSPVFDYYHKIYRILWTIVYFVFFRFSPVPLFLYRVIVLKFFGADLDPSSRVYPSARIWDPRNLKLGKLSTIGPRVKLYNQGSVCIGDFVIISQDASLVASTHDYNNPLHPLILKDINIQDHTWVCAEAFVGPGVTLSKGCVVGARAVMLVSSEAWAVYSGNPAQKIKMRTQFKEGR